MSGYFKMSETESEILEEDSEDLPTFELYQDDDEVVADLLLEYESLDSEDLLDDINQNHSGLVHPQQSSTHAESLYRATYHPDLYPQSTGAVPRSSWHESSTKRQYEDSTQQQVSVQIEQQPSCKDTKEKNKTMTKTYHTIKDVISGCFKSSKDNAEDNPEEAGLSNVTEELRQSQRNIGQLEEPQQQQQQNRIAEGSRQVMGMEGQRQEAKKQTQEQIHGKPKIDYTFQAQQYQLQKMYRQLLVGNQEVLKARPEEPVYHQNAYGATPQKPTVIRLRAEQNYVQMQQHHSPQSSSTAMSPSPSGTTMCSSYKNDGDSLSLPTTSGTDNVSARLSSTRSKAHASSTTEDGQTNFRCMQCNKTFALQRVLNRHMQGHSSYKKYPCTKCDKGFNDKHELKRHERTHSGVKPYHCQMCKQSFSQQSSLESHEKLKHGVNHQYDYREKRKKTYPCENCGHSTSDPEVHRLHLQENHPHDPALLRVHDKRRFKPKD